MRAILRDSSWRSLREVKTPLLQVKFTKLFLSGEMHVCHVQIVKSGYCPVRWSSSLRHSVRYLLIDDSKKIAACVDPAEANH